jgi:hypothetical protein
MKTGKERRRQNLFFGAYPFPASLEDSLNEPGKKASGTSYLSGDKKPQNVSFHFDVRKSSLDEKRMADDLPAVSILAHQDPQIQGHAASAQLLMESFFVAT